MNSYDDFLKTLPLGAASESELSSVQSFISYDEANCVYYYAINGTDACAVVFVPKDKAAYAYDIAATIGRDNLTVRLVYISLFNILLDAYICIPDTVCSIRGAENMATSALYPFGFEDNPYFVEECNWVKSTDGKDVIFGRFTDGYEAKLKGVSTIHNITSGNDCPDSVTIPGTVEKINRISGAFNDVTFEGALPEFGDGALDDLTARIVKVFSSRTECSRESVDALLRVPTTDDKREYRRNRTEENTLFLASPATTTVPKAKDYIALTNASFECDGDDILINTPWIATICPHRFKRLDGDVDGSLVLIGLKGMTQEGGGVLYRVYEPPYEIDELIADIDKQ